MNVPNWQHHSKKEQKIHLKPEALRQRKEALQYLKKKLRKKKLYSGRNYFPLFIESKNSLLVLCLLNLSINQSVASISSIS